jgi:hypothetical protein
MPGSAGSHQQQVIKNVLRGLAAAARVVLPYPAGPRRGHASAHRGVDRLTLAAGSRDGYQRTSFKHGNAGTTLADGCNTRMEALI